jgi:hypothetical protein
MPLWPDFRGEMVLISTTVQRQILTTQHEAGPGGQDGYAILKEKLGSKWTSTDYVRFVSRLLPMLRDARVARSSA